MECNGGLRHEVVWDNLVIHAWEGYVVLLGSQSCSCGKWDKNGIPCQHSIAAISFEGADPLDYIVEWFKKDIYMKAYEFPIIPLFQLEEDNFGQQLKRVH